MTTEMIAPEKKPKAAPKAAPKAKKPRDPSAPAKKAGPKRTAEERADALIERANQIRARGTEKRRKAFEKAMAAASAAFTRAAKAAEQSDKKTASLCASLAAESEKLASSPWGDQKTFTIQMS